MLRTAAERFDTAHTRTPNHNNGKNGKENFCVLKNSFLSREEQAEAYMLRFYGGYQWHLAGYAED